MGNELLSLSDIFQRRLFRIPDYQRGYAWQRPQLDDFWDDLYNLQSNRNHYTGMISLKNISLPENSINNNDKWMIRKGFKLCYIVDGQQRLTTAIILLNELIDYVRNLDENKGKKDDEIVIGYETLKSINEQYIYQKMPPNDLITSFIFGYEYDNPSDIYLRNCVFGDKNTSDIVKTYYTLNLKRAKNYFKDCLSKLYAKEGMPGIVSIFQKLTQNFKFNLYEIDDDFDVFLTFETMNNRGKKLTNLELLKNRLIYITTIYDETTLSEEEKNILRQKINDAWKEIYFQMGRNGNSPLLDDEYLKAHWIIYFTYSRKRGDDYIKYLLTKFSAKNVYEKTALEITDDVNDSDEETVITSDYNDDQDSADEEVYEESQKVVKLEPKEIADYVDSLKELSKYWYDSFFPYENIRLTKEEALWLDRLNRIGIGYFRPLVVVALQKRSTSTERVNLFKAIERFIFTFFRLASYRSYYQSSAYNVKARELFNDKTTVAQVTNLLNKTVDDNLQQTINYFITDIKNKFEGGNKEGYYNWAALKYFMFEYEYSLGVSRGIEKISWHMFAKSEKDKISIEHILPQTPNNWYWKNQFRQFIDNKDEMSVLVGSLGNLLPLAQSINSSLQNDSFDEKKKPTKPGRAGYSSGSYSELEVAQNDEWNALLIHERTMKLLTFMQERWNIPLSEEQKNALAYDGFIMDGRIIPPALPKD